MKFTKLLTAVINGVIDMFSLIIPIYKNEASLNELVEALKQLSIKLNHRLEVIFVVDGSPDNSQIVLQQKLKNVDFKIIILVLSRNFGAFSAVRTGMEGGTGPYYAVMAADLQEPPELILTFFETLTKGEIDIVLGERTKRQDPLFNQLAARLYWRFYQRFVQPEMPKGGIDVFGCSQTVRDTLIRLEESNSSLIGLLMWVGFRRKKIPYERKARKHGKSAWSFRKKINYLSNSIFSFSNSPIHLLTMIGFSSIILSIFFSLWILIGKFLDQIEVPGYASIVLFILFCTGINVLSSGIIGAYVWRIFENSKKRPNSIVMKKIVNHQNTLDTELHKPKLYQLKVLRDARGYLTFCEFNKEIPFYPHRIFMLSNIPKDATRGNHAHIQCNQFIICMHGSVKIMVDDGKKTRDLFFLDRPDLGVWIPKKIWTTLYEFSEDALVHVYASHYFDPNDYIHNYSEFISYKMENSEALQN